ncbi:MAG TPA: 2-amino-4-hydroxy-6-hydroxymethyldihydropteridine diphosphokinase [Chloroflexia bacterium]|nr:2-amino-4-hydroxy-6-hydroxymethyldihydropteridine diphosphokinase [Chloroflexia bacterium]
MVTTTNTIAYLGLGTNMGDRDAQLRAAAAAIANIPATSLLRQSPVYESKPWGKTDQPDFLNMVVEINTQLEPHTLHRHLQKIERDMGRDREASERWGPRPIDIDLLLYGTRTLKTASLVVPHPRMWERHFVMRPLADLAPNLTTPEGTPISSLLANGDISSQGLTLHAQSNSDM